MRCVVTSHGLGKLAVSSFNGGTLDRSMKVVKARGSPATWGSIATMAGSEVVSSDSL